MFGYSIALLAGTLCSLLVGSLWYSPLLFGTQWMKLVKMTPKKMKAAGNTPMIAAAIMSLLRSLVLVIFFVLLVPINVFEVISIVFIIWFGFIVPEHVNGVIWARGPKNLLYINAFSALIILLAQSLIIWYILQIFNISLLA